MDSLKCDVAALVLTNLLKLTVYCQRWWLTHNSNAI